jgi:hypothetical protein
VPPIEVAVGAEGHHGHVPANPTVAPEGSARRLASGTVFVLVCGALAVAFVLFLIFVSPILLERTLALAPPPAPQVIASGELAGRTWTATAIDGTADQRGVDAQGVEAVVETEPCLVVDLGDGSAPVEHCVERRGGSIRELSAVVDASGRALVLGIVAPEVRTLQLTAADGRQLELAPSYVDFGFPLGFVVAEVDGRAALVGAEALDRDGVERAVATCTGEQLPLSGCENVERDR